MSVTPKSSPNWLKSIISAFNQPTEMTIAPAMNRSGSMEWQVYDPRTEKIIKFDSEQAMIVWLDGHHN